MVTHDAASNASAQNARVFKSAESDNEDQSGERADADPDPLLLGESGRLYLIQVLRELMQVLIRELGDLLIDLLLREAMGGENGRHLLVRNEVTNDCDVRRESDEKNFPYPELFPSISRERQ